LFPTVLHGDTRELPTYVGIATLLLAIIGLTRFRASWRVVFWACVCVLAVVAGLGTATPFPDVAYHVPLYDKFRNISRHLFLFAFGTAVLAGFGVAGLQNGSISSRTIRRAIVILLALTTGGAALMAHAPGAFELETIFGTAGPGVLSFLTV